MNEYTRFLSTGILAAEWIIRIGLTIVVVLRHKPSSALAWLAFINFEPIIGLCAYLVLGRNLISPERVRRHREIVEKVVPHLHDDVLKSSIASPDDIVDAHLRDLVRLAGALSGLPAVGKNACEFIADPDDLLRRMVEDIDRARHHCHLLFYIWRDDAVGRALGEALIRASARGVQCRVLVDAVGGRSMLKKQAPVLRRAGVSVVPALPVSWFRRKVARIDVRNHRKIVVIDGRIAYVGSHNITEPRYGSRRHGPWRDLSARLQGPAVHEVQAVFAEDWFSECSGDPPPPTSWFPPPRHAGDVPIVVVPSGPADRPQALRDLMIAAVHEADRRIILTTPYFIPDEAFLLALRLAARGGVQVDVVVPARSNKPLVQAAGEACYDELLDAGVRIRLHQDGLLHSKTLTIDDTFALIGSGNSDQRSFELDYEMTLVLLGTRASTELRLLQEGYISKAQCLDPKGWKARPLLTRFKQDLARLTGPLL